MAKKIAPNVQASGLDAEADEALGRRPSKASTVLARFVAGPVGESLDVNEVAWGLALCDVSNHLDVFECATRLALAALHALRIRQLDHEHESPHDPLFRGCDEHCNRGSETPHGRYFGQP